MSTKTILRLVGAAILFVILFVIGSTGATGPVVLLSTFGFAAVWEWVVVRLATR